MVALGASAGAAQAAAPEGEIADIVVTAQRRSESIQNVPITIQALTSETLSQLSVTTFDDMVKEIHHLIDQMNEEERRAYFVESLFLNTVRYENDKLEAYMKKLSKK